MKCPRPACRVDRVDMTAERNVHGVVVGMTCVCGAAVAFRDDAMPYSEAVYEPVLEPPFRPLPTPRPEPTVQHEPRPCAWERCGQLFTPTNGHARYHTVECRTAANRAREQRKSGRRSPAESEMQAGQQ